MLRRVKHHIGNFMPALRYPNYRLYFIGQGISLVGTWMQTVAEQWLIYPTLTDNKSLLGLVSAVNLLPVTFLVLLAGVWADRVDRRRAQIILQSVYALVAFVMSYLIFSGRIQVWHVITAAFLSGLVFAFDMPTRQALLVNLVEKPHFSSALSLNGAIFNAARVVGPAIAGVLIAAFGIAPAYFLNGISFIAVIVSIYLMTLPKHPKSTERSPFHRQLAEGFFFVRTTPMIYVSLLLIAILTIFTWPVNTLLAVFAHDIFRHGELGFGLLTSAFGTGAMISALGFYTLYNRILRKDWLLMISLFMVTISIMIFVFWQSFYVGLVMLLVSGWSIGIAIGTLNTVVQEVVPDNLRGRILSYYSFVLVGSMPLGAILASVGVNLVGAATTVFFCILIYSLSTFIFLFRTRNHFLVKLSALV